LIPEIDSFELSIIPDMALLADIQRQVLNPCLLNIVGAK